MDYQGMSPSEIPLFPGRLPYHGRKIGNHWVITNNIYVIQRDVAEINITDACNLKCPNCQSACGIAPSDKMLDLKNVHKFVTDTMMINHHWRKIKCTGGEPTLHPQLEAIARELKQCNAELSIITNGTAVSREVMSGLSGLFDNVCSQNNMERKAWRGFESCNVSPIDLPEYQNVDEEVYTYGCPRTANNHGPTLGTDGKYYPCPTLYHIDRVFGLGLGVDSLTDLLKMSDREIRTNFFKKACRYCGFFKYPRDVVIEQITSCAWERAVKAYNTKYKFL